MPLHPIPRQPHRAREPARVGLSLVGEIDPERRPPRARETRLRQRGHDRTGPGRRGRVASVGIFDRARRASGGCERRKTYE